MRSINSFARATLVAVVASTTTVALHAEGQKPARSLYRDAQAAEKRLQGSESLRADKAEWIRAAKMYRRVVLQHPQSGYCDDALYYEAQLYVEASRRFDDRSALKRAMDAYLLLANGYPGSKWAKRARLIRGKLFLDPLSDRKSASIELRRVTKRWPNSVEAAEARRLIERMSRPARTAAERFPPGVVGVRNIRHWTGTEYTRIVIDLDDEVKFRRAQLENPDRIYFDLIGTRITKDLASRTFPVDGGFLKQIRVAQNRRDVVRVVLDFKHISDYKTFWLPDPYRLVVDISGTEPKKEPETKVASKSGSSAAESSGADGGGTAEAPVSSASAETTSGDLRLPAAPTKDGFSVARQLGLRAKSVVIDPGHGGHDPGTMDASGLREKDLVLDISRRVAKILEKEDFDVVMTRRDDVFIPLEERTAIANSRGADLFVSIHVNASRSSKPRGAETYYLNLATTPDAEEVAARENAVTTRRLGELQEILQKLMNNDKIHESRELATKVQGAMATGLFKSTKDSRNRGVKTAPFYVLLGARVPSVLVEVAYLSNKKDAQLLADPAYRQRVAASIASGVVSYQDTLVRTTSLPRAVANANQP